LVDKPGRRKKSGPNKGKITAVIILAVVLIAVGWYAYGVYTARPALTYARIYTTLGSFEVELFNNSAPQTVSNFLTLARSGFYDNLTWHRIEKGFIIQIGDPNTRNGGGNRSLWGQGTSGTSTPFEYDPSLHNYVGYLAMASTAPKVGGSSQFFINLANNMRLDGNYSVFGRVISGMDVVYAIGNVPTELVGSQHEPVTPIFITNIAILKGP
jgi:cyclophilin family peptidyl-prolyl cis-trans isomerase